MGFIDLAKGAWGIYWKVHFGDGLIRWMDGTTFITIDATLDEDLGQISKNCWDGWTGVAPNDYKLDWTLWDVFKVSFYLASEEVKSFYNDFDSWEKPEHVYFHLPRKDPTKAAPRFDLMDPIDVLVPLFTNLRILIEGIDLAGIASSIKTALLNLDPKVVCTNNFYYPDPLDGVYRRGYDCTPEQVVRLGDFASVYGLCIILIKSIPILKKIGRMGFLVIKFVIQMMFKLTKSATKYVKNKISREMMINQISDGVDNAVVDDFKDIDDALIFLKDRIAYIESNLGVRFGL